MKPAQTLSEEHEVIVQMLDVAGRAAQAPGALDVAQLTGLIGFLHTENVVLFRMADDLLTVADQVEIETAFARVNNVDLADVRQQQLKFVRRVTGKTPTK